MNTKDNGGPAFPAAVSDWIDHPVHGRINRADIGDAPEQGMSLRDYFAGQALANHAICTGTAPDYELRRWFGGRGGITRAEIVAAQAREYADAMLAERSK